MNNPQKRERGYSQSTALLARENSGAVFKLHSEYKPIGDLGALKAEF